MHLRLTKTIQGQCFDEKVKVGYKNVLRILEFVCITDFLVVHFIAVNCASRKAANS